MGNEKSSQKIPLRCLLWHFREAFKEVYGYEIKFSKGQLHTLCELGWPTFRVGWPNTGSFDPELVQVDWNQVTGGQEIQINFLY